MLDSLSQLLAYELELLSCFFCICFCLWCNNNELKSLPFVGGLSCFVVSRYGSVSKHSSAICVLFFLDSNADSVLIRLLVGSYSSSCDKTSLFTPILFFVFLPFFPFLLCCNSVYSFEISFSSFSLTFACLFSSFMLRSLSYCDSPPKAILFFFVEAFSTARKVL